ncbi:MAG: acetate--CoA ligase [Chloroflexi bacterium GWB2_49_20]|nr:MAG: acetate--CoA ligase [Chloroflexi bacterium GWB2_49_20]OGN77333.1 MAG: acetate--CoA ligase [Chloroflexi bacterium GWC2_49_37]OGN84663.1 MAG: acetate--CoA ligase [Chloroflexi bacterium GWD2_49_16]HBG74827.1 acetate--CoA ligase [Anaerolineae bacterium]HCC77990.1 acetate--CoA ligase [Anaerolineae bacterium]
MSQRKSSEMEGEVFYPSQSVIDQAIVKDWDSLALKASQDLAGFWEEQAEELDWFQKWETVLDDSNKPFYKWFSGARVNIVHNCIDRHLKTFRKNKLALIWESEDGKLERTFSYFSINREVSRMANIIKAMGVVKGDRVTIYMGRIPEIVFAMLACAKIGAIHSVVFGGFSMDALQGRIEDSQSKLIITCDGSYQNGKVVELKRIVDEAMKGCPSAENVIVVRRVGQDVPMEAGRDHWYHDLCSLPIANGKCPTEAMDSEDPLFILYTSGSTGKPKAILHTHGGYMVGTYTTLKYVFDLKDDDRWWCAADPGWITGHSYIVYGPMLNGATTFLFEGGPTYPYPNRWWQCIERYGISVFYTAPTAIRGLMRFGEAWPNKHDLSSLRLLGSVGEPINPEAWRWYYRVIGKDHCPIMDTWWQTETGMFMITPTPTVPLKPGSGTRPFFGQEAEILNDEGEQVADGEEGYLVLLNPWPAMLRGIYGDPDRYVKQYWSKYPGKYMTGDSAKRDKDGYFWIIGRVDDVIKVSGHRLGTAEVESALVSHEAVAEAAAIGLPHEIKGQAIHVFCLLRKGFSPSAELAETLRQHVATHMGPIARPEEVTFVDKLPKTRSGKIMRRVLKARAQGLPEGDISTLEE